MTGLYKGLRATTLAGQTGKVRRTQLINYVMKQGLYFIIYLNFDLTKVILQGGA